jgi:hypothetical protein
MLILDLQTLLFTTASPTLFAQLPTLWQNSPTE